MYSNNKACESLLNSNILLKYMVKTRDGLLKCRALKPYLLQCEHDDMLVLNRPERVLHLHMLVQLPVNEERMSLQADLQRRIFNVHH